MVRRPDGVVVRDETGRLAGRGAYVCRQERCLSEALSRGRLGRALAMAIPAEVRAGLAADLAALTTDDTITMNDDEGGAGGQE